MAAETLAPPDWASLPSLVVQQISEKVKSITDFVRFRAVCPSWRSSCLTKPRHLPPQIPWLMIPYNPNEDDNPVRLFYDLSQSKMHKIHLPETRHMMCSATSKGWLLLVSEEGKKVELLNPLTRDKITLPNFTTPVNVFSFEGATYEAFAWFVPYIGNFVITKVVFSSDPTEPGCTIMVFLQKVCRIFYCRVGDPCWTMVNLHPDEIRTEKPSDGTFYNNKFYLVAHDGVLRVYDLNAPERKRLCSFDSDFQSYTKYLLEGKSGVYLVVIHGSKTKSKQDQKGGEEESGEEDQQEDQGEKSSSAEEDQEEKNSNDEDDQDESSDDEDKAIELYQILDPEFQLLPIRNTSNITIFVGDNSHYLALDSDEWDSLKGDHFYMGAPCKPSSAQNLGENEREMVPACYGIFLASLEDGMGKLIAGDLGQRPALWPPAPALWFQPSLI